MLLSAKDGSVIRNLTQRLRQGQGVRVHLDARRALEHGALDVVVARRRSPRLLRAHREAASRSILQNIVTGKIEQRIDMRRSTSPSRPTSRPDGKRVAFSALRNAHRRHLLGQPRDARGDEPDATTRSPTTRRRSRRTASRSSTWRASAATRSCSGSISTRSKKTQLTFGTHDDAAAQFIDADTLVFSSTAIEPGRAGRARGRAERQHLQHLDAEPEDRRAAAVHRRARRQPVAGRAARTTRVTQVAFVSYYKGEYGAAHPRARRSRCRRPSSSDFGAPGPVIDFQAPLTHTLVAENKRKKGTFEKMFLDGRPPVNVGVTSGGDFFGGTQIIVQRRARRQAVQRLRRVDLAVPHVRRART